MTNEEILKIYPEAIWFPDSPPAVGTMVRDIHWPEELLEVIEIITQETRPIVHDCPYCQCKEPNPHFGWVNCRSDSKINSMTGELCVYTKYPPGLKPA